MSGLYLFAGLILGWCRHPPPQLLPIDRCPPGSPRQMPTNGANPTMTRLPSAEPACRRLHYPGWRGGGGGGGAGAVPRVCRPQDVRSLPAWGDLPQTSPLSKGGGCKHFFLWVFLHFRFGIICVSLCFIALFVCRVFFEGFFEGFLCFPPALSKPVYRLSVISQEASCEFF